MAATKPGRTRRLKPAGKLATVGDNKKTPTLILGDVKKFLLSKHGQDDGRRQDVVHPSEMAKADWCPRQSYYRLAGTPASDSGEKFNFYLENIFDEGHSIHDKWQSRLAEMGRLYGDWSCRRCDTYIWGTSTPVCPNCGAQWPDVKYREVPLSYEPAFLVAGKADGIDLPTRALIEIKSIGIGTLRMDAPALLRQNVVEEDGKKVYDLDGVWKGLRRPLVPHVKQANIYFWMAQHLGLPVDKVVFLYEFKSNQQVKEFEIPYSERIMEPILDSLADITYGLTNGTPPARPAFTGKDTKVCQACPFMSTCYGDNDGKSDSANEEHHTGTRRRRIGGQEAAGTPGDRDAPQAGLRRPRTSGRPHRSVRQPVDGSVQQDEPLGRVHGGADGSSRGRRAIRGKHPRQAKGTRDDRPE